MDSVTFISITLISLGLLGAISGTLLLPVTSRLLARATSSPRQPIQAAVPSPQPFASLAILIPSPQKEPSALAASLESLATAISRARRQHPELAVDIVIAAADHDDQIEYLAAVHGARLIATGEPSRWSALKTLVEQAWAYDWIGLVEPGTQWSPLLLAEVIDQACADPHIALVAPPHHHGRLRSVTAAVGTFLRILGFDPYHLSGMPLPVRASSTFYRSDELVDTFRLLRRHEDIHDDMVIPFVMRALHPGICFVGLPPSAHCTVTATASRPELETGVDGNRCPGAVECFHVLRSLGIHPPSFVTLTAIEYLIISGWVYWAVSIVLGTALILNPFWGMIAILLTALVVAVVASCTARSSQTPVRSAIHTVLASLSVPFYLIFPSMAKSH